MGLPLSWQLIGRSKEISFVTLLTSSPDFSSPEKWQPYEGGNDDSGGDEFVICSCKAVAKQLYWANVGHIFRS